jgi:transposase InsO family protein
MKIVRTPIRAPNANAYAERWVGTLRRECLDRILIVNRHQLAHVLRVYTAHYNRHRPHRSLSLRSPDESGSASARAPAGLVRNASCSAASSTNTRQPRDTASAA